MPTAPELNQSQINRVSKCLSDTRNENRDRAYFFTLLFTGMRVSEALKLSIGDVIDADGVFKDSTIIHKTKNGKSGRIYFPKALQKYLKPYLKERNSMLNEALFCSNQSKGTSMSVVNATRLIKKAFLNAGLEGYSSHSCRRTFAYTLCHKHQTNLSLLCSLLRHESVKTSMLYMKASTLEAKGAVSNLKF